MAGLSIFKGDADVTTRNEFDWVKIFEFFGDQPNDDIFGFIRSKSMTTNHNREWLYEWHYSGKKQQNEMFGPKVWAWKTEGWGKLSRMGEPDLTRITCTEQATKDTNNH